MRYLPLLLALSAFGCLRQKNDEYPLEGIVYGSREEIVGSFILTTISAREDCDPLPDADIQLHFDSAGKNPVAGFVAKTDAEGRYVIQLKGIPRSQTEYGNEYYLRVTKKGYETLNRKITIGPYSSYINNTVILKPSKEE